MPPWIVASPTIEKPARFIVNEDVVFRLIGDHEDPSLSILNHLVTVIHRMLIGI